MYHCLNCKKRAKNLGKTISLFPFFKNPELNWDQDIYWYGCPKCGYESYETIKQMLRRIFNIRE